jgi:hypothetical protein
MRVRPGAFYRDGRAASNRAGAGAQAERSAWAAWRDLGGRKHVYGMSVPRPHAAAIAGNDAPLVAERATTRGAHTWNV